MKSNNKKYYHTVGMVWSGCAILFFFFYMVVLQPQIQRRENLARQLIKQERAYNAAVKAGEKQAQAQLSGDVTDLQTKVKDFVVDFAESANLTFDIGETASRERIEAFSIKSQSGRSALDMSTFTCIDEDYFDVSFTSGFNQFTAFLSALERRDPAMLVDEFVITRSPEESGTGHHATLNLAVLVTKK